MKYFIIAWPICLLFYVCLFFYKLTYSYSFFNIIPIINLILKYFYSEENEIFAVNGICIGLAGKPSILGRASKVGDFVQERKDEFDIRFF